MSHYGISWLESPEREKEERVSLLPKNMDLKPGMAVADIGAGSGYHAVRRAKMVGDGKIYAVDVEPKMIDYLNKRIQEENYKNIKTILGKEQAVKELKAGGFIFVKNMGNLPWQHCLVFKKPE